jgi:DNA-binding response OmpR family regulator
MPYRFLIVEDQPLIAMELEGAVVDEGHLVTAIAIDRREALSVASQVDIALVDVNLKDGPTGPEIGETLAGLGVTVLFMTSDPVRLGAGIPGTVGFLTKPTSPDEIQQTISFLVNLREHTESAAPARLVVFA